MAGDEALEIFRQIEALISDKLQVVSYKWLIRHFSLPSNYAKRLLQQFADKHANKFKVVYTLSGWLKNNPPSYCVKLVSGSNLAEVKKEFEDKFSVQVYSVQACIPKDLAVLWNAEFVQAEKLFNQPSSTDNCLRDNRFCGVSNSYVKRAVDGKSVAAVSQLGNDLKTSVRPQTSGTVKGPNIPAQEGSVSRSSANHGMHLDTMTTSSGKTDRTTSLVNDEINKPHMVKESTTVAPINKKKGKNETSTSGGGSLASLWDRASSKSKPSSSAVDSTNNVLNNAITAETQICAHEAADAMSSDDDEDDMKYKRESNGASNRKRRVIMDFSDDEEEENVASLSSRDPPNEQAASDSLHDSANLMKIKKPNIEDDKEDALQVKQSESKEKNCGLSDSGIRAGNKNNFTGISLKKKTEGHILKEVGDEDTKTNAKTVITSTSPKRRKVLKTRIDERGREVTEVVCEGETADSNTDKNTANGDIESRPTVANKAQQSGGGKSAPAIQANKVANKKPAKSGGKDAKQGNILSFFKKV